MSKKMTKIIAVILCLLLAGGCIFGAIISASAGQVDNLKSELGDLSAEKEKLQKEMNVLKGKTQNELERKNNLDSQINLIENEIELYTRLITKLDNEIAQKEQEILVQTQKIEAQYDLLKRRIRATYEEGNISYIDLLLSSESYSSFLINMDIVSSILEQDEQLIKEMERLKAQIEENKAQIEQNRAEQEESRSILQVKAEDLDVKRKESSQLITQLSADVEAYKKQYEKAEAEERAVLAEIQRLSSNSSSEYVGGVLAWPTPGHTGTSDEFGMRKHPITGVYKLHTGLDIRAPGGANIVAANAGKVIKSTKNYAYGNYVVIDHGGGMTTLYAHMSKRLVSVGTVVTRGQTIGKVGTTGLSTGNHLHFEVIQNGKYQNPRNYFN